MTLTKTKTSSYLRSTAAVIVMLGLTACGNAEVNQDPVSEKSYTRQDIDKILADPISRSELIVKVMGSTEREDTHAFMKFHVYGFAGDGNLIPLFTMNNYIVQKWFPEERGTYGLEHYEVAYYSDFDTEEPLENWVNPMTGEINEVPTFILGPIYREYTPEGIIAPGIAPEPLNISVIGDRVYIPTQSVDTIPNAFSPQEEWGDYSTGDVIYWDSMLTFSAYVDEAANPETTRAPAEIHMQNMVSWAPYMRMGLKPGRTMVRAFGQHISGPEELPETIRENLEIYAPQIFDTDNWTEMKIDSIDYFYEIKAKIDSGEIVIE